MGCEVLEVTTRRPGPPGERTSEKGAKVELIAKVEILSVLHWKRKIWEKRGKVRF